MGFVLKISEAPAMRCSGVSGVGGVEGLTAPHASVHDFSENRKKTPLDITYMYPLQLSETPYRVPAKRNIDSSLIGGVWLATALGCRHVL